MTIYLDIHPVRQGHTFDYYPSPVETFLDNSHVTEFYALLVLGICLAAIIRKKQVPIGKGLRYAGLMLGIGIVSGTAVIARFFVDWVKAAFPDLIGWGSPLTLWDLHAWTRTLNALFIIMLAIDVFLAVRCRAQFGTMINSWLEKLRVRH